MLSPILTISIPTIYKRAFNAGIAPGLARRGDSEAVVPEIQRTINAYLRQSKAASKSWDRGFLSTVPFISHIAQGISLFERL